jgi:hypothetical protein
MSIVLKAPYFAAFPIKESLMKHTKCHYQEFNPTPLYMQENPKQTCERKLSFLNQK